MKDKRYVDLEVRLVQDLFDHGSLVIQDDLSVDWIGMRWDPSVATTDILQRMLEGENFERKNFYIRLYTENIYSDTVV